MRYGYGIFRGYRIEEFDLLRNGSCSFMLFHCPVNMFPGQIGFVNKC
jgi:hypothetical protein